MLLLQFGLIWNLASPSKFFLAESNYSCRDATHSYKRLILNDSLLFSPFFAGWQLMDRWSRRPSRLGRTTLCIPPYTLCVFNLVLTQSGLQDGRWLARQQLCKSKKKKKSAIFSESKKTFFPSQWMSYYYYTVHKLRDILNKPHAWMLITSEQAIMLQFLVMRCCSYPVAS